ncbi:unnamed protein product [Ectocarpus sp. 12 AP-2014]
MARFAGLGLEPILADSDDDDGDMAFRRGGFGIRGGEDRRGNGGGGSDAMTDTWQNEFGNIKVNDRGMRVAQRDGQEELLLEGQVVPDQLVFGDGRIIGRGACSVVNLARHKDTGQLFAVKVFSLLDREKRRQLDREIGTLLRSLENGCCSHLVDFFGAFKRPDGSIRVVLEYMDRGSLADVTEYRTHIQARWNARRKSVERESKEVASTEVAKKAGVQGAAGKIPQIGGANGEGLSHRTETFPLSDEAEVAFPPDRGQDRGGLERLATHPQVSDDDDDMPATLERLGGGAGEKTHRQQTLTMGSSGRNGGGGGAGIAAATSGIVKNLAVNGSGSSSISRSNGVAHQTRQHRQHRTGSFSSNSSVGESQKQQEANISLEPLLLSEGALATPAAGVKETLLERGRGQVEAPWLDDNGDGGAEGRPALRLEQELEEDDRPEAAERRRVEAAAELERQREQEEWDRAFEEELVQTGLPEDVVAACVYQILGGLTYLHEHNQLHRDVKPSNILLNARGEVKLTDFGIARELDHAGAMVETVVGTVRYMSPERLHGEAYGRPADVWGLGLVMIECVTQQEAPYADGCSQIEILQTLKEHGGSGLLPSGTEDRVPLSDAFVGFVGDCLRVNPEDRLSTAELLNSRWFVEQGVHGREEAVDLMAEYLEGLYGPHAFKYFGDPAALEPPAL